MEPGLPTSSRRRAGAAPCGAALAALLMAATVSTERPRFYQDDPIAREPETQDASGAQPADIGLMYELAYNLFATANDTPSNTRAKNINTIDELPDSSWFTNRIAARPISEADLARGPAVGAPPAPEQWTILRE